MRRATLPRPPTTVTISAKVVQLETRVHGQRPAHRGSDRDDPGQRSAQPEDDRSDEGRVDADEPRADLVLDHGPNATPKGRHTEEDEERRAPTATAITDAQMLPTAIGTPTTETGSPPM